MKAFQLITAIIIANLAASIFLNYMLVDDCLDLGGTFDYMAGECQGIDDPSYIPLLERTGLNSFRTSLIIAGLATGFATYWLTGAVVSLFKKSIAKQRSP